MWIFWPAMLISPSHWPAISREALAVAEVAGGEVGAAAAGTDEAADAGAAVGAGAGVAAGAAQPETKARIKLPRMAAARGCILNVERIRFISSNSRATLTKIPKDNTP